MSKQITLDSKIKQLEDLADEKVRDRLEHIANYAIFVSPVDTGAYVESFSMLPAGKGGGRSKKSEARAVSVKEGTASREQFAEEARSNLYSDIKGFSLETSDRVTLRNRAPHAREVEDKLGWSVFTKVRNKFGG